MGTWPTLPIVERYADLTVPASSTWTTITAAGSTNTKGSYTQLIASTTFASASFVLGIRATTANWTFLIDIAVGAAASEQVILPNVWFRTPSGTSVGHWHGHVPIAIKESERVAVRCQSSVVSATCFVGLYLCAVK